MAAKKTTPEISNSTVQVNDPVDFNITLWKNILVGLQNGARPKKRQKISTPSPGSNSDNHIMLIRRNISLRISNDSSYSQLFDGFSHSEEKLSLEVDCNTKFISKESRSRSFVRPGFLERNKPGDNSEVSMKVYLKNENTLLLGFIFKSSNLSPGAREDVHWNTTVRLDNQYKTKPPNYFKSRATLFLIRDDQDIWSFSLLLEVIMESTNEWSERSLDLSRKNYWELLAYTLPNGGPNIQKADIISPRDFYHSLHVPEETEIVHDSVQHEDLNCELLPFQRRAVKWMLQRERVELGPGGLIPITGRRRSILPPTFFEQLDKNGQTCFVSHILGIGMKGPKGLDESNESGELINGGILAEEMGLGKTIEIIALLCLHRRQCVPGETIWDEYHGKVIKASGSTLIITPPSILHQWQSEISKHSPNLKVFTYEGVKRLSEDEDTEHSIEVLMRYDVVLTTYSVLASEVHFAQTLPERPLRYKKVYKPKRSPLVEISWWRVCLDEAQMVESGVSNAASVAREIPRVNAWCVTGTPVRKNIDDCFGLLLFLRYKPLCNKHIWNILTRFNHDAFKSVFKYITVRNSKDAVSNEISLPQQNRMVVTVPFSQVEEQNYLQLFAQMCEEVGLNSVGAPIEDNWKPDHHADKMRAWLMRLRQTCLHPEAGERNRKAFGLKNGPLRTLEEVLGVMIEQHILQLRINERSLFSSMIKRGQMHEHIGEIEDALTVWQETLGLVQSCVAECRKALAEETKAKESTKVLKKDPRENLKANDEYESDDETEDEDYKKLGQMGAARMRLRHFLELEHACCFWIGTAYFQLRENKEKKDGSKHKSLAQSKAEEYKQKETENYELAKQLRLELMHETRTRALKFISTFSEKADKQSFVEVPDIDPPVKGVGGIESQPILDSIEGLADVLNEQVIVFDEWREKLVSLLLEALVDEDDDKDIKGDEFQVSVDKQEENYAYISVIRALLADREESLTEIHNSLIEQDTMAALQRPSKIHSQLFAELITKKAKVNPLGQHKSMKRLLNELRALINNLKQAEEGGSKRARLERAVAELEYKRLQKMMATQTKACAESFKEIEQFRNASNARIEFYRQVQAISDTLLPLNIEQEFGTKAITNSAFKKQILQEKKLQQKITEARSKSRYLAHLSGKRIEERPTCLICLEVYEVGIISNCGHSFCKECILIWRKTAHNCPACKNHLRPTDFFQVTYSPMDLAMQNENTAESSPNFSEPNSPGGNKIYANVDDRILREIKRINLKGSYGSKIDMITRHLLWLKRNEPGFKAVIFSQWGDVLEVVKGSLKRADVGFASLEKKDGTDKFKHNPDISCFLLHAKSQSAGLTLVNATHVFLCEPLLNVGIELQAISRVHRIGQIRPTTVWLYVINNTVEQSVLELSTRRRTALIGQSNAEDEVMADVDQQFVAGQLIAAESNEMREGLAKYIENTPGAGEMVMNEDLWDCLFGKVNFKETSEKHDFVRRELVVHAAELRTVDPREA